jgi:hypothetical protein
MRTEQTYWTPETGWFPHPPGDKLPAPDLALVFWSLTKEHLDRATASLCAYLPRAIIAGCSTAGEILGAEVRDGHLVCTTVSFSGSCCQRVDIELTDPAASRSAGAELAKALPAAGLRHVLVFSDGLRVNGTELVDGMQSALPEGVGLTGGLAADGELFSSTAVWTGGGPRSNGIAAVGLYGKHLRIGCGSFGGWDPFGPERLITHARGNKLFSLDGYSALSLYKKYLGEYVSDLPASALLFPLSIRPPAGGEDLVRTVLSIDEQEQSMTFAGDVPEGHLARFMKCNMDRLIDGAAAAAAVCCPRGAMHQNPGLALLVSCVGRRMVLRQRIEEELESVRDILGDRTTLTGFYSYGEISPLAMPGHCELRNQTMTITTIDEIPDA